MPSTSERCTTCGDSAVVVRILERDGCRAHCVDGGGKRSTVELEFVPEAQPGEAVLVHFGVAIARVRPELLG